MRPATFVTALRIAAAISLLARTHSWAVDYYWDADGASTTATGGTGNWTLTDQLWLAGSDTGTPGPWVNGNAAILGGTAGTLTTTAAIQVNRISVLPTTVGTTYTIAGGTGGSVALFGANKTIDVAPGKTLSIGNFQLTQVSGTGETDLLTVQGGGTLSLTRANRAYAGSLLATGAGTTVVFTATNGLSVTSTSTGLTARDGGTIAISGSNNYYTAVRLGDGFGGGTLKLGQVSAIAGQSGLQFVISGTSKSTILSTLTNTGTDFGAVNAGGATRAVTVGATGDPSGVDLEYSAGWRNGALNKLGVGVLRLNSGFTINKAADYTTFVYTDTALSVNAGTFLNEGTVKSMTAVGAAGLAKTGATTGTFDAVTVNSTGVFELSRSSGVFTAGLTFAANQNSLTLNNGGTLKYVGVNTDISASLNVLFGTGGTIDTNGQNVSFATGLSGAGGLTKSGPGTLTLNGPNAYTGTTTVNDGVLALAGSSTVASSLVIDVKPGATFDVTGVTGSTYTVGDTLSQTLRSGISGTVNATGKTLALGNNATLAPGNTLAGTLSVTGNLAFGAATTLSLELSPITQTVGNGLNDLVTVSNNLTLDGVLNVSALTADFSNLTSGTWSILTYSGTLVDNGLTLGTMPALDPGYSWQLNAGAPGVVNLSIVPEPSSAALALFGLVTLARRRRSK